MTAPLARMAATAATVLLLGTTVACGGGEEGPAADSGSSSSAAEPADEQGASEGGDAPAGGVTFVDTVPDPAATVTVSKTGFDPAEISVSVGDVVRFTTTEGIYGVIVHDIDGKTVTKGLDEYFRFDEPGTYPVREDISGSTATVTVQ